MRLRTRHVLVVACLLLAGCKTELNSGLSQREANEMVSVLLRAGIPASRTTDEKTHTETVFVEDSRFADAVDLVSAHGFPRNRHPSIGDIFKGDSLVSSPTEERARMVYALGEELSRSIGSIDGVLDAQVHIVLPDNDPLKRDATVGTASVFIRHSAGAAVEQMLPQIKQLVANGVSGLSYDKVSVVMVAAPAPAVNPEASAPVSIAGIWVTPGSARPLQLILGAGAAVIAALLAAASWLAWRVRASAAAKRPSLVLR